MEQIFIERRVYTLLDLLADVGGLKQALVTLLGLFFSLLQFDSLE